MRLYQQDLEKNKLALAKQQQDDLEYERFMKKQMKSPKRMAESDPTELNIGIRLYQKGIKKLEEKERFCK